MKPIVNIPEVGAVLNDTSQSLCTRFRALFMLKNVGGDAAVAEITRCLMANLQGSDLLNHELAYCLGQMQNETALPTLNLVLDNSENSIITRHEAAEALGAIGLKESLEILKKYSSDPVQAVSETCQLAYQRINSSFEREKLSFSDSAPYKSYDPVLPTSECFGDDLDKLETIMMDTGRSLYQRYEAMFVLRDMNTPESAVVLAKGLKDTHSALFRHEIAFVLGQMQLPATVPMLIESLSDVKENCMVRHECAEALGSIADEKCLSVLHEFKNDKSDVVKESCIVALDMYEYENSTDQFHYAI